MNGHLKFVVWLDQVDACDPSVVGPKSAALARVPLTAADPSSSASDRMSIPDGFVVTTEAFRSVMRHHGRGSRLTDVLERMKSGELTAKEAAGEAAKVVAKLEIPESVLTEIDLALAHLTERHGPGVPLAVRSSATAEDLVGRSFAGQYDSVLGVSGASEVYSAYLKVVGSLFSRRVLGYHISQETDPAFSEMAVSIQTLIRADLGAAGVVLTSQSKSIGSTAADSPVHTSVVEAANGLGGPLLGGERNPDVYHVRSTAGRGHFDAEVDVEQLADPTGTTRVLGDEQLRQLHAWGTRLAKSLGYPIDMEWALDGIRDELVVVQVRAAPPESAERRSTGVPSSNAELSNQLVTGLAVGVGECAGRTKVLLDPLDDEDFNDGDILVTETTSPLWMPLMLRAGGLVTDRGGRTSHAAIVCRELGLLAVVGCRDATTRLADKREVRIDCGERGVGVVYG